MSTWHSIETAPKDWSYVLGQEANGDWWLVYWDGYAEAWRDQLDNIRRPIWWFELPEAKAE